MGESNHSLTEHFQRVGYKNVKHVTRWGADIPSLGAMLKHMSSQLNLTATPEKKSVEGEAKFATCVVKTEFASMCDWDTCVRQGGWRAWLDPCQQALLLDELCGDYACKQIWPTESSTINIEGSGCRRTRYSIFKKLDTWRDDFSDRLVARGWILLSEECFVENCNHLMVRKGNKGWKKYFSDNWWGPIYAEIAHTVYRLVLEGIKIHILCASKLANRAKACGMRIAFLDPVPPPPAVLDFDVGTHGADAVALTTGDVAAHFLTEVPVTVRDNRPLADRLADVSKCDRGAVLRTFVPKEILQPPSFCSGRTFLDEKKEAVESPLSAGDDSNHGAVIEGSMDVDTGVITHGDDVGADVPPLPAGPLKKKGN